MAVLYLLGKADDYTLFLLFIRANEKDIIQSQELHPDVWHLK